MKPLTASEIRGNWATLVLPIRPDESIDYELLGREIDHFHRARVNGIYSNGTAGEFYTLTEEDFDSVNQVLAEKCERLNIPFQTGVSHMSPQISLGRLKRARAFKPSGFQIILPDWFPPTLDEIFRFLDVMVAAADPIPLILYNPPHAKRKLIPSEWIAIADRYPGIAGIKVPGGDAAWYDAMRPLFSRLSVFIPGHTLATGISRGAHGAYSNMACLNPAGAQAWYELCLSDLPAALKIEKEIGAFISEDVMPLLTVFKLGNMAADKALAVAGGWLPGLTPRLRWPYKSAPDEEVARIAQAARKRLPNFF